MRNQRTVWQCFTKTKALEINLMSNPETYIQVKVFSLRKLSLAGLQHRDLVEVLCVKATDETLDKLFRYESVSHALKLARANIDDSILNATTLNNQTQHTSDNTFSKDDPLCPDESPVCSSQRQGNLSADIKLSAPLYSTSVSNVLHNGKDGGGVIFCDTETTGQDRNAEVCEIAIVDEHENVLFESLVKPSKPIPQAATKIHGITNEMVANAPTFAEIWHQIEGH